MKIVTIGRFTLFLATGLAGLLALSDAVAEARAWKSKFGSREIKGEFAGLRNGKVTLKKADGGSLSIPLSALSPDDQDFAKAAQQKIDTDTRVDVLAALQGKMMRLEDGKSVPYAFARVQQPHHVLFYVISTSCPSCNDHAPVLKEFAKKSLNGTGIEIVIISIDEEKEDLEEFLAGQKIPFSAVAHESKPAFKKAITPRIFRDGVDGCQTYILTSAEGKVIVKSALIPKREIAEILAKAPEKE
jgi:thiol-disulfide isomerase/thioredoxin